MEDPSFTGKTNEEPPHMKLTIEEIKRQTTADHALKRYVDDHLEHNAAGKPVCPFCGSGSHKNKTSAFGVFIDKDGYEHFKCQSCGQHGDIFDLIGEYEGLDGMRERAAAVCHWDSIPFDGLEGTDQASRGRRPDPSFTGKTGTASTSAPASEREETETEELSEEEREKAITFVRSCREAWFKEEAAPAREYMAGRGFSADLFEPGGPLAGLIGYDAARGRVLFPFSSSAEETYYTGRAIDPDSWEATHYGKYRNPTGRDKRFYNLDQVLEEGPEGGPLWIVEGVTDVLALEAVGSRGVALCGCEEGEKLADRLMAEEWAGDVLINLDRDEAGRRGARKIVARFKSTGDHAIRFMECNTAAEGDPARELPGWAHDTADAFGRDPDGLREYVRRIEGTARERRFLDVSKSLKLVSPVDCLCDISAMTGAEDPVSTGLKEIDRVLSGGLHRGLYVLGAISSLGKTTLLTQIAEAIAYDGDGREGRPVLFVTIEQSAEELMRKTVTRGMYRRGVTMSSLDLATPAVRGSWQPGGKTDQAFDGALNEALEHVHHNLRFQEGIGRPGTKDVKDAAEAMAEYYGRAPIVMVDYLQILAPEDPRATEKQAVEASITDLRQISRDMRTPVIVVSSLNRSSYSGAVGLDSFKESGGIEYGADVLLGLQPRGMAKGLEGVSDQAKAKKKSAEIVEKAKAKETRPMDLIVLKNREGPTGGVAKIKLHAIPGLWEDDPLGPDGMEEENTY